MVPYAVLTALPSHCSITIPNADSLRLSHYSHSITLSQNLPPFSCLLPPTSNMLSNAKPNPIDLKFLNAHSMLCLSFMEAMSAALGKSFSEGFPEKQFTGTWQSRSDTTVSSTASLATRKESLAAGNTKTLEGCRWVLICHCGRILILSTARLAPLFPDTCYANTKADRLQISLC